MIAGRTNQNASESGLSKFHDVGRPLVVSVSTFSTPVSDTRRCLLYLSPVGEDVGSRSAAWETCSQLGRGYWAVPSTRQCP
jgi:hypothetical protein